MDSNAKDFDFDCLIDRQLTDTQYFYKLFD